MFSVEKFGKSIRLLRVNEGLTVYQLAIMTDVNYSSLSKIELGKRPPTITAAINLLNYFSVSIAACLDESENIQRIKVINQFNSLLAQMSESDVEFLSDLLARIKPSRS